ncbi:uncharacterized protein M421DRAFT_419012 [Didymella exigua CBS 183.55]|uniref:Uncharacterized protein n=1 Tax=Didymella exigua CBS 183.55 TaxID=1150837 RepID=A0A6A5RS48_9PLEO|nr:uncharacterized protein M421DRAFT_419012 [Didymella exigua CBS 183.55]KAF1929978.1 hypothetical protein M421DRAFT_419012 [Didymella exigua CBS 183.55]
MDAEPSCAICSAPNHAGCHCESERLQIALDQAESRAMDSRLADTREWVLFHARHHIQLAFQRLSSIRQHAQTAYLNSLPHYDVYMRFSGAPPIHPLAIAQLQSQIAEAHAEFKRGIDLDWRASVLRYPEVLDYFYSLVDLKLPGEDSRKVIEPPFAAAGYQDRGYIPAPEVSRVGSEKPKKKKRRDSAGMGRMERMMWAPPEVPSPPSQRPGYGGPVPGGWR